MKFRLHALLFSLVALLGLLVGSMPSCAEPVEPTLDLTPTTRATPPRAFVATARFNNGTTREVTDQVLWSSTNTAAALVGNSQLDRGVVSAVADGDTTMQATDAKTGVAGRATVFVTGGSAVLQAIVVTPNPAKVAVGAIQEMTALGVYSDGTTKNLTKTVGWSSSRESRESRPT